MAQAVTYILEVETKGAQKGLSLVKKESSQAAIGLDKTRTSGTKLGTNFKQMAKRAALVVAAMGAVALAAKKVAESIIKATKAVFNFTRGAVDAVNRLNDLSTASGLSADTIQGLEFAFLASGQSLATAESIIKRIPLSMKQIMKEGTATNEIVEKLTGNFIKNGDHGNDTDIIFRKIIESLQGIQDQSVKSGVAVSLFGRQSADLMIALGNAPPFQQFIDFTKEYGVDAERSAAAAAKFQQALAALSILFAFAKDQIVFTIGSMDLFTKAMKLVVGGIVFVSKMAELFGEEIAAIGNIIKDLTLLVFKPFINSLNNMAVVFKAVLGGAAKAFNRFNNEIRKIQGLDPIFLNVGSRIKKASEEAKKAQKKVAQFGSGLSATGRMSAAAKKQLEELRKLLRNYNEDPEGNAQQSPTANMNRTAEAIKRAKEQLKTLQQEFKDQIINTDSAYRSAYRLERTFAKLGLPVAEVKAFKEQLKGAMDEAQKAKFDKEAGKIKEAFLTFVAEFESGGVSLENALQNIDGFFDKFKEFQIDTSALEKFKSTLSELKKEADKLAVIKAKFEFFADLAGVASDAASGNIENVVAKSLNLFGGTIGAIIGDSVGSVLGGLAAIGEKTPEQMEREGKQRIAAIARGIEMLPAVLIEVLPPLFLDLALRITGAIVNLPAQIAVSIFNFFKRIVDSIKSFFSGEDLKNSINDGLNSVANFLTSPFDRMRGKMNGGYFHVPQAANGLRFTGEKRGLAMLHEGEVVVPRSGRVPQGIANSLGGGGGINLTINSAVVDGNIIETLVRQIEERFTQFGSSTSTVLG